MSLGGRLPGGNLAGSGKERSGAAILSPGPVAAITSITVADTDPAAGTSTAAPPPGQQRISKQGPKCWAPQPGTFLRVDSACAATGKRRKGSSPGAPGPPPNCRAPLPEWSGQTRDTSLRPLLASPGEQRGRRHRRVQAASTMRERSADPEGDLSRRGLMQLMAASPALNAPTEPPQMTPTQ